MTTARSANVIAWTWWIAACAILLGAGFWLRGISTGGNDGGQTGWRPWTRSAILNLYFPDGPFLLPVSRRMSSSNDLPRAAVEALLAGQRAGNAADLQLRSVELSGGTAHVDLSGAAAKTDANITRSIVATLTHLPGVTSVVLSVDGTPVAPSMHGGRLLYFASPKGLVAVPSEAANPRDAVSRYLAGPSGDGLTGFPSDVQLRSYDYKAADRLVSLDFSYTSSVRTLALEAPQTVRFVLLGLIASLTEFPEVQAVQIDFDGHTRLGVGQCSDLLRSRQRRPELLNDERLMAR